MKRFEVKVVRDGEWWMVHIPEIEGLTQARDLTDAAQAAASFIAVSEDIALSEVEVVVVSVDDNGLSTTSTSEPS